MTSITNLICELNKIQTINLPSGMINDFKNYVYTQANEYQEIMQETNNEIVCRRSVENVLGGNKVRASIMRVKRSAYYAKRSL